MQQQRQALPTLIEVLTGQSVSPVDLDSFYEFMRQNYSGVQYLTFWVDSTRHLALCREFANSNLDMDGGRGRYKSGSAHEAKHSPSSSMLFDVLQHGVHDSEEERRRTRSTWRDTRSSFRFGDARNSDMRYSDVPGQRLSDPVPMPHRGSGHGSGNGSSDYRNSDPAQRNSDRSSDPRNFQYQMHRIDTPTRVSMYLSQNPNQEVNLQHLVDSEYKDYYDARDDGGAYQQAQMQQQQGQGPMQPAPAARSELSEPGHYRNSSVESPPLLGHSRVGSQLVTRQDIYNDVDKLVEKYLTPSSSNAIVLPGEMAAQIRVAAQGRGKDDPELFEAARDYVFSALERESYPAFLHQRALCNVQPDVSMLRIFVGLVVLFGAFWLGFAGILINWRRPTRCFVIIPFMIGWYLILSSVYNVDSVLGLSGWCESMNRSMPHLDKVEDPYVRRLMRARAAFVLCITLLVTAAFCVLFIFVPGRHL